MSISNYTHLEISITNTKGENVIRDIKFLNKGVTLFFNSQHHLIKLSPVERSFFDFLCEQMRVLDNDITISEVVKTEFKEHLARVTGGKKKVTLNQLTKFVQKLSGLNLILKTQNKGRYIVNPKYVFKGSESARIRYLKKLIENRVKLKLSVAGLIHIPETEFFGVKEAVKK